MKELQRGYTAVEMLVAGGLLLVFVGIGGWVANIVKMAGMDFASITGMLIVRAVGIVVPLLGAVMGFI
jgi:hypothetical protein